MISLEEALRRILLDLAPLPAEELTLAEALNRVTASDLASRTSVPAFDNSSVDGYAVRASDVAGASPESPVFLPLAGTTAAGEAPAPPLVPGTCRRILTGAPLPPDADAVVMQEDTRPGPPDRVAILDVVRPWENVRFAGEDLRAGAVVVPSGTRLQPAHLGLLASAGRDPVPVHRRPRASLFSTGNELVPPGQPLGPGQIHDSNQVLLRGLCQSAGAVILRSACLRDDLPSLTAALQEAARDSDLIVTTGGVSVGDADLLKPALAALGGTVEFWRVAMKPGKPFAFGRLGSAVWFGLPGNPVSAFATWHLLALPALRRLQGARDLRGRRIAGTLAEPLRNPGDRRHFVRVRLDASGHVHSSGTQASHLQAPLALADGLVDVPPNGLLPAGDRVEVLLLD